MTKLRIAYLINSVEGGGAALPVPAIARVLQNEGADVRVFALTGRDRRALPQMLAAGLDPLVREGGDKDHLAAIRWLLREVQDWGATHLWTSLSRATILGLISGQLLKLPVVSWQHNAFLKPWNRRLMRLLQSRALLWVGDSHSVTELTISRLSIDPARILTWPIYAADPVMPQASGWQPGTPLQIGSLGRLHPNKGYDILFAALARLQAEGFTPPVPLHLIIAGEGSERAQLEAMAQTINIVRIEMPGYVSDPRAFLQRLHLYLQPSRSEGFCIAAHEALNAGLPVIGAAIGEMPHTITDGVTGRIVASGDVDALADLLREVLNNPQNLYQMGLAARNSILNRYSQIKFEEAGAEIVAFIRSASPANP
jgi:glycosyltransferase involved in cell wall biosynthesis